MCFYTLLRCISILCCIVFVYFAVLCLYTLLYCISILCCIVFVYFDFESIKYYCVISNLNSEQIVDIYAAFIKIHPLAFNEATRIWDNGIALLLFSNELPFSNSIQPISLPNQNYTDAILLDTSKTKLIATGWGRQFQKSLKDRPIVPRGGGGANHVGGKNL